MRYIDEIIIHCADTKPSMDIGVAEITEWHKDRGFDTIGYHYVIRQDGTVETGRDLELVGAHCRGHNRHSIGVCWVGGFGGLDDRSDEQIIKLEALVNNLVDKFPLATVHGHDEFSSKTCPNYDVAAEYYDEVEW